MRSRNEVESYTQSVSIGRYNGLILVWFLLLVLAPSRSRGQEVPVQNTNATDLRWNELRTENFNILFPKGFDQQAQRMANTLEHIREPEAASMGAKPRRISVLLQNQTSVSNGFVTLAPRRSEFFTMPPQNYNFIGTNDWLSLLAAHEYRHIVQYQRSIVGFNKYVYYLLGQNALSLTAFTAVPQWFWEGDAVATETTFTGSGRGRIPYFNLLFKTNLLEGRSFNYHKQYLRSYKHNIPDHYVLGYNMISYLRNRTNDPNIWDKVATRAWSYPFIPFTFSRSIRKETGLNVVQLYREMADSLRDGYQREIETLKLSKFKRHTVRSSKAYTDFLYPQPQEDGSIIALRTGIGDITTVVQIKSDGTVKKFVTGPYNDGGQLSAVDGKAVWTEYRYDPRWRMRTYSVVKGFDFGIRKQHTLSGESRFGSAALSPDGTAVATIQSSIDYSVKLVVLDYSTGAIIKEFPNEDKSMISMPRWAPDGKSLVAIRLLNGEKFVSRFDFYTGVVTDLFKAGNENVGHPVLTARHLFFNSPYSGIDNIYAIDLATGERYQVTNAKYGAYNPAISPDGEWIFCNDQTRDGMDIVSLPYEPSLWTPISNVSVRTSNLYDKLVTQEEHPDIMKDVPTKQYPVAKYNRLKSMVNIHSWGPFFDSDFTQADIGIYSRNLLGTTTINAGYLFDINERTGSYHAGLSYQGLYPIIDFNYFQGNRKNETGVNGRDVKFTWQENTVSTGVRLPFLLTRSKFNTTLTLKNNVGLTQVSRLKNEVVRDGVLLSTGTERTVRVNDTLRYVFDNQVGNGKLLYNQFTFSFANFLKTSRRDFNPRWAQLLDVELYSTPFGGDFSGYLTAIRGVLYFPGLAKHHNFILRAGQQEGTAGFETDRYSFRNRIGRPRGFSYPKDSKFQAVSINYAMPLWYPDLALGPFLNIQRLRTNLFYDRGRAVGRNYFYHNDGRVFYSSIDKIYQSAGAEFTVDVNVMRLLPQLDVGVRVSYLNPTAVYGSRSFVVEFVLGTLNL